MKYILQSEQRSVKELKTQCIEVGFKSKIINKCKKSELLAKIEKYQINTEIEKLGDTSSLPLGNPDILQTVFSFIDNEGELLKKERKQKILNARERIRNCGSSYEQLLKLYYDRDSVSMVPDYFRMEDYEDVPLSFGVKQFKNSKKRELLIWLNVLGYKKPKNMNKIELLKTVVRGYHDIFYK